MGITFSWFLLGLFIMFLCVCALIWEIRDLKYKIDKISRENASMKNYIKSMESKDDVL